jgi:light-regulated signal transduction histidine kinase (bacteriophytochrome)
MICYNITSEEVGQASNANVRRIKKQVAAFLAAALRASRHVKHANLLSWFQSHGSRHRGTGPGLSIVRSFVELHGGRVTLDSTVGRGTTVVCTFPLERRAPGRAAA